MSLIFFIMINLQKVHFILLFYFFLFDISYAWNLTSLNLSDDVLIWRFAVWRNRAFLAIPRSNEKKERNRSTLVEVPWPEFNSNLPISMTNGAIVSFTKKGTSKRNYDPLMSVTGLDVDVRGRLWILVVSDEYNNWPRIRIYDLKRNDRLVSSTELTGVSSKYLKMLVIDPFENQWGTYGYIGDAGDETIIVYSLGQHKWWKLKMLHGSDVPRVHSTDIAISRRNPVLYMTGQNTHDLFSINLESIRIHKTMSIREVQNVTVKWVGKKLGSSTGLLCDLNDGLHYFMISERASVRWDTKLPLNAQSHSILMQSNEVPCITDYTMAARRSVWGLVNSKCPEITKKNISYNSILKFRTVKLS